MRTFLAALAIAFAIAVPAAAQRDFITPDEANQLRAVAQEPALRLKLWVQFARQRLDQVEKLVKEDKAGRAGLIHDLLDQYTQIIDSVDTEADEALRKKADVAEGMKLVAGAEKEFSAILENIRNNKPKDYARYEFVLGQAIETTKDSLEAANEDLGVRGQQAAAREEREKKQLEGMMQPKDVEKKQAEEKKQAAETSGKRKAPSLLKKGETLEDVNSRDEKKKPR